MARLALPEQAKCEDGIRRSDFRKGLNSEGNLEGTGNANRHVLVIL